MRSTDEPFGILNPDLLESAVARPRFLYHYDGESDIVVLATCLLFAIARNHAFRQGNKRAGFVSALMFMAANGYSLILDDTELLGRLVTEVIENQLTEAQFVGIIREFTSETPEDEIGSTHTE